MFVHALLLSSISPVVSFPLHAPATVLWGSKGIVGKFSLLLRLVQKAVLCETQQTITVTEGRLFCGNAAGTLQQPVE